MKTKLKIKNGFSFNKHGWKYIHIRGTPRVRGYAYGALCADDFKQVQHMLAFFMLESFGQEWPFFIKQVAEDFKDMIQTHFAELYEEMDGIAHGMNDNGCKTSLDEILAWNFYMSIPYYMSSIGSFGKKEGGGGGARDHCSAFIAVGRDWTEDGKIVCAHNSFCDFIDGQYCNIILDIYPDNGHRIIMQTSPGWIWSGSDFFITSKGIIGTETTIGGFMPYEKKFPIGFRIRKAMQYGNSLDDYVSILLHENSGDYANSWLFGNIHTNEIMRIELGLKYHAVEKTKNGYFIGFNAPYDEKIRNLEVTKSGFYDIRRHQGARKVRLGDLMDEYKGKINIEVAKKIIGDHYDVYLQKENPCSRTVCSHYELDPREYMSDQSRPVPFSPHGAVDGMICSSDLAKNMAFLGKFGSSCNIGFDATEFIQKHKQFKNFEPYLKNRPTQPWSEFQSHEYRAKKSKKRTTTNKTIKKTKSNKSIKARFNKSIKKTKKNKQHN